MASGVLFHDRQFRAESRNSESGQAAAGGFSPVHGERTGFLAAHGVRLQEGPGRLPGPPRQEETDPRGSRIRKIVPRAPVRPGSGQVHNGEKDLFHQILQGNEPAQQAVAVQDDAHGLL